MSVSFVKLFNTLTDSSVWALPDGVRVIWITLLSMANSRGNVHASIVGVANRARKSIEEVDEALRVFMAPDPHSRTKDLEGRRIVEIDGGWHLVNYEKHRAAKSAEAVRDSKREWWYRNRGAGAIHDPHLSTPGAELEKLDPTRSRASVSVSLSGSGSDPDPEGGTGGEPKSHGATSRDVADAPGVFDAPTIAVDPRRSCFAPDDFEPTEAHRVRIRESKLDAATLVREFKAHEFARPYSDWNRAFSRWIETARLRAETERGKRTLSPRDRPNQPNHGVTGYENAEFVE